MRAFALEARKAAQAAGRAPTVTAGALAPEPLDLDPAQVTPLSSRAVSGGTMSETVQDRGPELLAEAVSAGRQGALLWGDLAVPTVVLAAETVVAHVEELLDMGPLFWLVAPVPEPMETWP
ncbi:hypothetical protein [Streptomyces mirabilis]